MTHRLIRILDKTGANTLAYLSGVSATKKKRLMTLSPVERPDGAEKSETSSIKSGSKSGARTGPVLSQFLLLFKVENSELFLKFFATVKLTIFFYK
jgi:hypothetical protein